MEALKLNISSLEKQLSKFHYELLNSQCADSHLVKLTDTFSEWQSHIAVGLGLTLVEIHDIEMAWPREPQRQRMEMFRKWKVKMGKQATYRKLLEVLYSVQRVDMIDDLQKIVNIIPQGIQMDYKLVEYGRYLKDRFMAEIGLISFDWPPQRTKKIFNLAMIKENLVNRYRIEDDYLRMTITGKVDDILDMKSPVKLQDIFQNESSKRNVIIIEGAPGSGKTTLALHICQKWGEGELFQEFTVVIIVQLRDPTIQYARSIADLLPCRDSAMAEEIAAEIIARDGEEVLWILDGWDELPTELQYESICKDLIFPPFKSPITKSTVLVTTRPISAKNLCWYQHTSRIEILGFTTQELKHYLAECLKDDPPSVAEGLLEKIQENPILESSCYLPLNAAVVAHVYRCNNYSLPNTQYKIFLTIILNFIYRHIQKEGSHNTLMSLDSFQELPGDLTCHFEAICKLAYDGMMENKVAFQSRDLPQSLNTLGLLQAKENFGLVGRSILYYFPHLTFQELLAAYYIANNLTDEEQVLEFKWLVESPRYNMVFQFYAAITKLEKPGFPELVSDIASKSWLTQRLLPLLRCIYEVKDKYLCYFIANRLQGRLELLLTYLGTPDCLAIGYFLSHACDLGTFTANFSSSYIGNQGYKFLLRYLTSSLATNQLNLCLPGHLLDEEGLQILAQFLQSTDSKVLHSLTLGYEKPGDVIYVDDFTESDTATVDLLLSLSTSLTINKSLIELSLVQSNVRVAETNGPALAEMLQTNKSLQILNFEDNPTIGDIGAHYIAEGLKRNNSVKILNISKCGLTAKGAETIAHSLIENKTLQTLNIDRNCLYDAGVISLAHALISNASLRELSLASCHMSDTSLEVLGECLTKNSSLRVLQLKGGYLESSSNVLTVQGMLLLAHHLSQRSVTLEQLKVSKNLVCSEVTKKLQGKANIDTIIVVKQNYDNTILRNVMLSFRLCTCRSVQISHQ